MLAVKLRPGERLLVNGAVLHNGHTRSVLYFANRASILRERDVMQEEAAATPTRRVYFIVQLMLLDPVEAAGYVSSFEQLMTGLLRTLESPPILKSLTDCVYWVGQKDYYKALATLRPVLDYEAKLLSLASNRRSGHEVTERTAKDQRGRPGPSGPIQQQKAVGPGRQRSKQHQNQDHQKNRA